jgi:hypothetical protein
MSQMSTAGYKLSLVFVILRCTRGTVGITIVGQYCVQHWQQFVSSFDDFCIGLVRYCRQVCKQKGKTYLSHREGYHTGLSGMAFISTLGRAVCRKRLQDMALVWSKVVDRLVTARGRSGLKVSEVIELGEAVSIVVLAFRKGRMITMGSYNIMDTMRCFMAVTQKVLRCCGPEYTEELHAWFMKKQSKKYREEHHKIMFFFGHVSCTQMTAAVRRLQGIAGSELTVTTSTMQVLLCETRQAINAYTTAGVCYMLEKYRNSKGIRDAVESVRIGLLSSDRITRPHTLQMFDAVLRYCELSVSQVRQQRPRRMLQSRGIVDAVGACMCPKIAVEGIPEWRSLSEQLGIIMGRVQGHENRLAGSRASSYQDLQQAAVNMGIARYCSDGTRRAKRQLAAEVSRRARSDGGMRKRTFQELEEAVSEAGGTSRPYLRGVRRRMNKAQMEAFLEAHN